MAIFQGIATFPGINPANIISASYTLSHGVSPSVITISVVPQPGGIRIMEGPVAFRYGPAAILIQNCRIDDLEVDTSRDGKQTWTVRILDRRWRWRDTGQVSGNYNTRRGDGDELINEKKPRELAELCLKAMGETTWDVAKLPDKDGPEVEWDYTNPAAALESLANQLGCHAIYDWRKDRVTILPVGEGGKLPVNALAVNGSVSINPPETPDKIVFVGSPTRWQWDFELEPVGKEVDGKVLPIDELSYKPAKGWQTADFPDLNSIKDIKARALAQESVFKWYRVFIGKRDGKGKLQKVDLDFPHIKKKQKVKPDELWRVLPTESEQVLQAKIDGETRNKPAEIYGLFWAGWETTATTLDDAGLPEKIDPDLEGKPQQLHVAGFSYDAKVGIVKFNSPVYQFKKHPAVAGQVVEPAYLRLRVAFGIRDKDTRAFHRDEVERELIKRKAKAKKSEPRYLTRDDTTLLVWIDPIKRLVTTNRKEFDKQAKHYLDQAVREYAVKDPQSITYAGLLPFQLDGAIRQITWTIGQDGRAFTSVSRNREDLLVAQSYAERRFVEKLQARLAHDAELNRVRDRKAEKAKGG